MDYHEVRQLFIKRSGRYDLVDTDWNDNGADFFLNAAQRMLDRLLEHDKSLARSVNTITSGQWYLSVVGLEAIKEVWVSNSDGKSKLEKKTITEIRDAYYEVASSITPSRPYYYAPGVFRPYPDTLTDAGIDGMFDTDDIITTGDGTGSGHFTYNGIIWAPPSNGTYTLSIWGKFISPVLSAVYADDAWTETKSFWTELHPDILIVAALYKLEVFYRNTEGANDWLGALRLDLTSIDNMSADQQASDMEEMDG